MADPSGSGVGGAYGMVPRPPCKKPLSLTTDPKMPLVAAAPLSNRIYSLMLRQ